MQGRTTIVIAHRLSTIEHADRIVVLDARPHRRAGHARRAAARAAASTRGCTASSSRTVAGAWHDARCPRDGTVGLRIAHTEASLRLGRTGDPHPDRGRRDSSRAATTSSSTRRPGRAILAEAPRFGVPARRAADRRASAARRAAHCVARVPRASGRRRQHAQLDRHAGSPRSRAAGCACAPRAPAIVRTRHVSVPVPHDRATRWLYRSATARIVTTGEALREQLDPRQRHRSPRAIDSVPTGIDPATFAPQRQARRARARSACREACRWSASSRRCAAGRAIAT